MTTEFTPIAANEGAPPNLNVVIPGFMGNVVDQTAPVMQETLLRHGEALLVQPGGGAYDARELAERSAAAVSLHLKHTGNKFESITFTGISLGGVVVADTINHLSRNNTLAEYSLTSHATLVDTPSGLADLAGVPRVLRDRPALARRALGAAKALAPLLDKTPIVAMMTPLPKGSDFEKGLDGEQLADIGKVYREMAKARFGIRRDQVEGIVTRESPQPRSLDVLASLAYIRSLGGNDVVIAQSAIDTWGATVGHNKFAIYNTQMPHAAFDQAPHAANNALRRAYRWHKTRRDHAFPVITSE